MRSPFTDSDGGHLRVWALLAVPLSVGIHLAGLVLLPERPLPKPLQNRPVEMEIVHIAPPPPPEVEPEVEPPPPPPPPTPAPPKPVPPRPPPPKPAPPPPPHEEAAQLPDKPVPIVAGVTLSSTTEAGSFSAPVGNTSHGAMQGPATRPEDVKPYAAAKADSYALPGEVDVEASVLFEFKPPYPEAARRAGIEGTVRLRLWLDAEGKVQRVRVVRQAGYGLDEAAQEAIMRFKFRPARKGGKPVPINFTFDFHFYLD